MNTLKIMQSALNNSFYRKASYAFLMIVLCSVSTVLAQDDYFIYGSVKDSDTFKKLTGVEVTVLKNGSEFDNISIGSSGKFEVYLPLGYDYTIIFSKDGFVAKRVFLETSKIPVEDREGGFETNVDMTLFAHVEGFNTKILEQPIGKAGFDNIRNSMDWDFEYTEKIKKEVEAEFKRLENAADDELRKRAEFEKAVQEGDQAMAKLDFAEAVAKYSFALAIIPDDAPVQAKLADAEKKLKEQRDKDQLEKQYQQLIADGQKNMSAEKWENAKENYTAALDLKPQEKLPKDKLAEIDKILSELSSQAAYDALIADGQENMDSKSWDKAKEKFNAALAMKPNEKLPKDKLAEIDKILSELSAQEAYDALIADADKNFNTENYAVSIEKYEEALKLMPLEEYPREQIRKAQDKLDAMLDEERRKAELEKRYQEFITLADRNFNNKSYEEARRPYEQASELKPEEKYPKDQLAEIDRLIEEMARKEAADREANANAEQDRINREYQAFVDAGNELFAGDDLEGAREKFVSASDVKPEERYPKNKIEEIDRLIKQREEDRIAAAKENELNAEQEKIDKEYQRLVDEGNELFDSKELNEARTIYLAASDVKPNEKYPKSRVQRIDEMLADMERQAKLDEQDKANQLEEERLAAERERLAMEQEREEERLRRLEEEKELQASLAEEARIQKEKEATESRNLLNNVDSSREDDVERYYREARDSELKAKYNNIKKEKERLQDLNEAMAEENKDRRDENRESLEEKNETMAAIHREGRDIQDNKKRFKAKEREEWESKDVEWSESFGYRRLENKEKAEDQKLMLAAISENDRIREQKVEQKEQSKQDFQEQQSSFEKKGRALAADSEYRVEAAKMGTKELSTTGNELQKENADIADEKKELYAEFKQDASDAAEERTMYKSERIDLIKSESNALGMGKEVMTEQNAEAIELKKESNQVFSQNKAREARIKHDSARIERFSKDAGTEKDVDSYILPEGAEDLQDGVNETSYELPGKTVIERTVKIGNKVEVYRKVISKTATYYFKENRSITESTWRRETMNLTD